jgi:hypothetical protein
MLCKGYHYSHLCPRMDEASCLLKKLQLPTGYHKISPNPSLVDGLINLVPSPVSLVDQVVNLVSSLVEPLTKVVDQVPSLINPTFHLKSKTQVTGPIPSSVSPTLHSKSAKVVASFTSSINPTPPLKSAKVVNPVLPSIDPILPLENKTQVVDLIPSLVDPTLHLESKPDTAHVFLIDTEFIVLGGIPPSLVKPPPSNEAILFDWGALTGPHLPSHIPFKITIQVFGRVVPQTLIYEGAFVSILSSIAWQAFGYPQLVPVTQNLLAFNRRTSHPLGVLPQFPVTLGGKNVFIDVMVVQDPLDLDLLLGRDYVYAMKSIVSTLFCVISFPHDGRIVAIDQLSCIGTDLITNPMTSLNGSYMQMVLPPPQVNYVALSPMPSTVDEDEPLTISSTPHERESLPSPDLDPIVDMVISSIGISKPDLSTLIEFLDVYSFQSDFLPSSEDLLKAMIDVCPLTCIPSRALSSWEP